MNHSSAALLSSTASEAIVSIDGRIKRRIPNYETIVLNISDKDHKFAAFDAVNDDFADIPVLLDPIETDKRQSVSSKRHGSTVFGAIIIITFFWSIYSIFFSPNENISQLGDKAAQKFFGLVSKTDESKQLKKTVELMLHDNDWSNSRINSLLEHWSSLNKNEQQRLTNLVWFQHFIYAAQQKIKQLLQIESTPQSSLDKEPLIKLGSALGILDKKGQLLKNSDSSLKYQTLVDEIKQEIAQVETATKKDRHTFESEKKLNALLKQQLSAEQKPAPQIKVDKKAMLMLLTDYKRAYENGDLENMLKLFGVGSNSSQRASTLASNFENIFSNTSKRSINFYDYTWQVSDNSIIINSKYNGMLEFQNRKGTQHIVARAKIQVSQNDRQYTITSFELQDSTVNVVSPQIDLSRKPVAEPQNNLPQIPNASELQDLTTQLVTAYETGDIEQFISLFSENAKTNDRDNLSGIKQDYIELFNSTSDRQMFIQDLRWSGESNSVKGTGDLEVTILSNSGNTVYSMNGKIQIVAQKTNNRVHITHMYHIEHKK
ncbi:hypothetical protein [Kaarinaea lacus]